MPAKTALTALHRSPFLSAPPEFTMNLLACQEAISATGPDIGKPSQEVLTWGREATVEALSCVPSLQTRATSVGHTSFEKYYRGLGRWCASWLQRISFRSGSHFAATNVSIPELLVRVKRFGGYSRQLSPKAHRWRDLPWMGYAQTPQTRRLTAVFCQQRSSTVSSVSSRSREPAAS